MAAGEGGPPDAARLGRRGPPVPGGINMTDLADASASGYVASSVLREAGALDAAGRRRESLALLSRAAGAGDLAAMRTVGLRILLGDGAPALGVQGVGLIQDAARGGDAEAAGLAAVLAGAGIYRPQDWDEALDWLVRAAELGSARARGALGVLCADAALGADADAPDASADLWRRLRESVDIAALTTPPSARILHDDPSIRAFSDFASPRMCAWITGRAGGRLSRAEVYDAVTQTVQAHETRTNSAARFALADTDLVQIILQARIAAAVDTPFGHLEASAVLHYAEGEQITEHFDFIDPDAPDHDLQVARDGQRMATFLVYLNDDYESGETEFPRLGVSHKGEAGEALVFVNALPNGKADVRTVHAGRPPRNGEKWIVSQFIRNRPSLPGTAAAGPFNHPAPA